MQKLKGKNTLGMIEKHKGGWHTWTILSLREVEIDKFGKVCRIESV